MALQVTPRPGEWLDVHEWYGWDMGGKARKRMHSSLLGAILRSTADGHYVLITGRQETWWCADGTQGDTARRITDTEAQRMATEQTYDWRMVMVFYYSEGAEG